MKKFLPLFAITLSLVGLLVAAPVSAASNGLGITPRKDYTITPGSQVNDTLYVSNLSQSQALDVAIRVIDFRAQNETGTPALELQQNAPQTPWSLKPFISSLPSHVTIAAGKSKEVPITISIPKGQGAGSYYSAIEYAAQNSESQKKVNIAASSASLVFVTVPGKTRESLNLLQFGAFTPSADGQTGRFGSFYFGSAPKELAFRLQDGGNVAEQPNGSILIKNMFGKRVRVIEQANPKNELALRGQIRRFEACIKTGQQSIAGAGKTTKQSVCVSPGLWPGHYSALLDVFYGLNGNASQEIKATASFWYLPLWFIIAVLVVIALIILALAWVGRKITHPRGKKKRR